MADKIVAEYIVKTDQAVKNIDKLQKEVNELSSKGKKSAKDIESNFKKTSSSLISQFSKVGAALGIAFSAQQVIQLGKEMVNIAAKAEGVERAFARIGSPKLLADLRAATRGTVSDLLLMQRAVQASNFKIPLEQLASLLKFAQARARETGESVDYLVDSIVLGIGRKSPLILDNLGISAVELRERLKGVGVEATSVADIARIVGDIATDELAKMGEQADTTADKIAQMGAVYQNALKDGGNVLIDQISNFAHLFGIIDKNQAAIDEMAKSIEGFTNSLEGAGRADLLIRQAEVQDEIIKLKERETRLIREARKTDDKALDELIIKEREIAFNKIQANREFLKIIERQLGVTEEIADVGGDFDFYSPEQIALLEKVTEEQQKEIRNVAFLKAAIKDLTDERELEGTSVERVKKITQLLIPLQEELNKLLGKETAEQKKLREELEKIALIRSQVFTGAEMAKGIPFVTSLSNTLNGLNKLLKEQKKILEESPEFSKRYNDASDAIDKLEKKIKEFNDDFIDPSLGNPDATAGSFGGLPNPNPDDGECDLECQIAKFQKYANAVSDIVAGISSAIAAGHASELASLESQLEASQITREEYDKKRRKIERQAAIDQKNAAIFQAVINTALAVSSALTVAPPAGYILAGISAALGAVEIGVISSQPLPQFAEGGWVDSKGKIHGRKHAQGGVHLEAEGDEFIVKGAMAKKNASLLEALNKGTGQDWINKNMVYPAIQNVIDNGGLESNSGQWGNITASLKDHNIIASQDRMRQSMTHGFKYLAKELKGNNLKRGGYNA